MTNLLLKFPMMKKSVLLSLLFAMFMLTATSCDDNDYYYDNAPFLGAWMQDSGDTSFTFYANGTGVYTNLWDSTMMPFTWSYDNYYLSIYFDNGWDEWDYQWSLYGNTLTLYDLDTFATLYYYPY